MRSLPTTQPALGLAAALLLATSLGCASGATRAPGDPAARALSDSPTRASADPATRPIEQDVIRLTNAHRRARALPPLREDPFLADLARAHSRAMARSGGSIHHQGIRGRFERARTALPLARFGENVARTRRGQRSGPARWVVTRWIGSESHRAHLEGAYGRVGVGVARTAEGDLYFTQLFAATRDGR